MQLSFKTYPGHVDPTVFLVPLAGATGVPAVGGYATTESAGGLYTTGAIADALVGEFEAYALNGDGDMVWSGYWHSSATRGYDYTRPPVTSGTGPYLTTITVEGPGAVPIAGAVVRALAPAVAGQAVTDVNGQATLALEPGSYNLSVTAPGFVPATQALTVAATAAATVTLAAATAPPSTPPGTVVGYWVSYDEQGEPEAGVEVVVELDQTAGGTGYAVDSAPRTVTSGVDGLTYVPGLHPGCAYRATRGAGPAFCFVVPGDAAGTIALDDIHGYEDI